MQIKFNEWDCRLVFAHYPQKYGGRVGMSLVDADTGEPIATCTTNVPEAVLGADEVLIKDWSENEGMLASLIKAGVVEDTGRKVQTEYVYANICKLLVNPDKE